VLADLGAWGLRFVDPETAHEAALRALEMGVGPRHAGDAHQLLVTEVAGLHLPNPLGLAAGFDKDARAPDALLRMGFGFVECGTVTPKPQPGNPRPRLFRLAGDRAVINRMGFNNGGLTAFCARLAQRDGRIGLIGANVGANKDSTDRIGDYAMGLATVWPVAAYVTINVSSPNTPGLRGLQERGALSELLSRLAVTRDTAEALYGPRPVFLKIAPDLDEEAARDVLGLALAHQIGGLIISNTTIARPAGLRSRHAAQQGGLSGAPLFEPSTALLRDLAREANGKIAFIGAGGVASGAQALAKIKAGAGAVQLYSALALQGPSLVGRILDDLALRVKAEGFASVRAAVGADWR
jgi:dihydroorotate dehydrogenase